MEEQHYLLTIQNRDIFKEIDVSKDTPLLRIGNLQDCDVRLSRDAFSLPVLIVMQYEAGGWRASCGSGLYFCRRGAIKGNNDRCVELRHGDILELRSHIDGASLLELIFSYDFSGRALDYDTIVDIRDTYQIVIGNSPSAHIKLGGAYIGREYITLTRGGNGLFTLDAAHAPTGATLNGIRQFNAILIHESDFIGIADYSFYYKNGVLYMGMRDDVQISGVSAQPLRDENPAFNYPKLDPSPRMLSVLNKDPIEVLNPPEKPEKPRDNLVMHLTPALLMITVTIMTRSGLIGGMTFGSRAMLISSVAMASAGIITSIISFTVSIRQNKKDVINWKSDYTAYIENKRLEIETEQQRELAAVTDMYPKADRVRDFVKTFSGRLFERSYKDADFLHVRAGVGQVPALRAPKSQQQEKIKTANELMCLPEQLCSEYAELKGAPVMLHLRESGSIGVIGPPGEQYDFFKNILLDVCVYHYYEEVQAIVLIPQGERQKYEWVKWLPHIKNSGGGMRGVVCDEESRDNIFEYLYTLLTTRSTKRPDGSSGGGSGSGAGGGSSVGSGAGGGGSSSGSGSGGSPACIPHIVVFVLEEYGIKSHPLIKYTEDSGRLGISFIYFKQYLENLPRYCNEIVELNNGGGQPNRDGGGEPNRDGSGHTNRDGGGQPTRDGGKPSQGGVGKISHGGSGVLRLRKDKAFALPFEREHIKDESIKFVAERLAPVYSEKIALSSQLTANITLFELLNIIAPEDLDLLSRWSKSNVQRSLAAPLGVDVKNNRVELDLHERAHGPHGLVAGTTGSGKSEIMQSYILSAAVNFHPYEVSFVLIDFKGGGMANQFERLPHMIGKITDIDSHEIDRSLLSIRAELEKRKRLFAEYEVNHIDNYIRKYKSGEAITPLPHLILIVDEFAELKADQPEFMKELISTARVGRSLGIHLILATQKPAGQVNEQIWSNSRFKLCLKVATLEDSREVIKSPLAAEILEPGRAYLQVGNNEIFTLFQSAYSGASVVSDKSGGAREFVVSEVSFTGKRSIVYERKAERSDDGTKVTQLKAMVEYIHNYCERLSIARLPSICPPPLPDVIAYEPPQTAAVTAAATDSAAATYTGIAAFATGTAAATDAATGTAAATDKATGTAAAATTIRAGIYDDPANQLQPEVTLNLSDGNIMVIGSAQTGKTTLLQTMLRGIAESRSPGQVSVYILDFASKVLKIYETLNHVGGVMTDADDEKLKNFFKMMYEEIERRKEQFSQLGISSYAAYMEIAGAGSQAVSSIPNIPNIPNIPIIPIIPNIPDIPHTPVMPHLPHIVIMLDNLSVFKEVFQEYEDAMLNICREGLAVGVTVVATAKQTSGLSYKYLSNFATRIAFNCNDRSEYGSVFDRCRVYPKNTAGRGLTSIDKAIYEFQAYLPFDGDTESKRVEQIKAFIADMRNIYGAERARSVPSIPAVLKEDHWASVSYGFGDYIVPVGLTYNEIEPVTVDLAHAVTVGIYGREGFGKSNLIRLIMKYLYRRVFELPCEAYLIDGYDRQLAEFESFGFVRRYTIDCSEFGEIVQTFSGAVTARMDMLKLGGNLDSEPLLLCIVQNQQIYAAGTVPKAISDQFKKLVNDAKRLKICFIFANIDNNPEYSPPEIMKAARDFSQYFLLDDVGNVKLFGANKFGANDLKQYKKAVAPGDGYTYDARAGLVKIKLVKCESMHY